MRHRWLLAVCVVLILAIKDAQAQDPEIVNEILPEVKPVGRTARLNCTVARLQQSTVAWALESDGNKQGKTISVQQSIQGFNQKLAGKFKYEVEVRSSTDRITFMLIIRHLVPTDAGKYRCSIRTSATEPSKYPSKLGTLTVQVAPTVKGSADAVKEIDKRQNATLNCDAIGIPHPNITWTRSDGGLLPILPRPRAQFRGAKLHLTEVDVRHMGVYRCVADNNIKPPAHHLCEVLVFHPPSTRVVQNSVGQAKNRRLAAKLECIVQGHPAPTVTWWRMVGAERKYITDDDHYEIHKQTQDNQNLRAMEQWYTLKIKNVQANDYTIYICEGSNKLGNHSTSIELFETTECQGANCPSLNAPGGAFHFIPSLFVVSLLLIISVFVSKLNGRL